MVTNALLTLVLGDPVGQGRDLLDVRRGLGGADVHLLLDSLGGEGALRLEVARGDVVVTDALGTEADVDGLHVEVRVPLASHQVGQGDAALDGLYRGDEGAQSVNLHRVALGDELDDTAGHLRQHAIDDVTAIDRVVLGHVVAEAAEGDGLLLDCLGVVLSVSSALLVLVLTDVDLELWSFYCHSIGFKGLNNKLGASERLARARSQSVTNGRFLGNKPPVCR